MVLRGLLALGIVTSAKVCFFDSYFKYNYVRPSVMDTSISYFGPVVV
jgi:hypothetical protein